MRITRRQSFGLIGSALAAPVILRSTRASAAVTIRKIGPPIQIGGGATGSQEGPRLAGFPNNGSFLVAWTNFAPPGVNTAWCQYFSSAGAPLTAPIDLGAAVGLAAGTARDARPLSFDDGSALVFFCAEREGAPSNEDKQLFAQRMSPARTKDGPPVRINDELVHDNSRHYAVELTNGNVMVAWQRNGGGPTFNTVDAFCRVLAPDGTPVSPERRATLERSGAQFPTSVAALSGAKSVIGYSSQTADSKTRTGFQVLNSNGTRSGDPVILKTTSAGEPYGAVGVASEISTGSARGLRRAPGDTLNATFTRETTPGTGARFVGEYKKDGARLGLRYFGSAPTSPQSTEAISQRYWLPDASFLFSMREPASSGAARKIQVQVEDLIGGGGFSQPTTLVGWAGFFLLLDDAAVVSADRFIVTYTKDISGFDLSVFAQRVEYDVN